MNANFCSYCGARVVDDDSRFCTSCGRPLAVVSDGAHPAAAFPMAAREVTAPAPVPKARHGIRRVPWYVRVLVFIVGVVIMVIGWKLASGDSGGQTAPTVTYPAGVRDNFMKACLATGGGLTRCQCSFRAIEARIDLADFVDAERVYSQTGVFPAAIQEAAGSC